MGWLKRSVLLTFSLFILKTQAQPRNATIPYNVCLSHVEPFVSARISLHIKLLSTIFFVKVSPSTHLRPRLQPQPQVYCRGFNETKYTGFDVSLFRDAALRAGLGAAGDGYNFRCMPTFQGMLLNTVQGITCDIALSSITITVEREQSGLQFTYPYLASQLGIMVATTKEKVAGWNWTQPFSWDLWLATAVTLMIFPFCVVLIEFGSLKDKIRPKDCIRGNIESTSRSLWTMVSCGLIVIVLYFFRIKLIRSNLIFSSQNSTQSLTAEPKPFCISSLFLSLEGKHTMFHPLVPRLQCSASHFWRLSYPPPTQQTWPPF